ncbi:MAG TPA: hypothetical protein VET85_07510 [Stellaceae bacterium]|nr:hypothetical protein [Stellaceae bacterium]
MRSTVVATIAAALMSISVQPAPAQNAADGNASANERPTGQECRAWNGGADARQYGWTLSTLDAADKAALIDHYNRVVAPRADAATDDVIVASHPGLSLIRVIIVHRNCIVDMAQMGPVELQRVLQEGRTPV